MDPRRVLVVDDIEVQRRLFSRRLGMEKFDVFTANSGLDALTRVQTLHPDLVLADISMPHIGGIEMLKIMRKSPHTATIPVILMTGMPIPADVLQAAADGLKAGPIHVKGDNFTQLLNRIKNILGQGAQTVAAEATQERSFRKGTVTVNLLRHEIVVAGQQAPPLKAKRFDLLVALLDHDGPVDQSVLLGEVWGHKTADIKLVQVTVARLREDLKGFPAFRIKTEAHTYELVIAPVASKASH